MVVAGRRSAAPWPSYRFLRWRLHDGRLPVTPPVEGFSDCTLEDKIEVKEAERAGKHLRDCADCRQRLTGLTSTSDMAEHRPTQAAEATRWAGPHPAGTTRTEVDGASALPAAAAPTSRRAHRSPGL